MGGAPRHALLALAALALNAAYAFKLPNTAQDLTLYRIWDSAAVCNDGTPCAQPRQPLAAPVARFCSTNPELAPHARRPDRMPHARLCHAAGFYYLPANDTAKADMWLIYLEGGQWCGAPRLGPRPRFNALRLRRCAQVLQQRDLLRARAGRGHAGVVQGVGQGHAGARRELRCSCRG